MQVFFGSAFAAVPRLAEPEPPLDPWADALQEVTRPAPEPQEAEPVLVPVSLPGPGAEAARLDPPARLADPLPLPGTAGGHRRRCRRPPSRPWPRPKAWRTRRRWNPSPLRRRSPAPRP